ncbi:MAG: RagB/SusD family nutrient uptake outer membrane protein [Bacteroidia bacterium]|nr:RagB/SusD family nutrient uptake outer membrane protein [Bacteroidia bacterium]
MNTSLSTLNCFYLLWLPVVLNGLVACNESLDVPPNRVLESDYFLNEAQIRLGIGGVYAKISDIYAYNTNLPNHLMWLLPGDDLYSNSAHTMDNFINLNAENPDLNAVWMRYYQLVNRANTMLEKIEERAKVYQTPHLKDYNQGELLFLRSWAFYKLWHWWEKAPLATERKTHLGENLFLPPSEGLQMLDTAIRDLETAATLLPVAWPAPETGRVTQDAAYGLLVKCYLSRACFRERNTEDYQKAITAYTKISDSRALTPHFGQNFDYRYENNEESLFEFQASQSAEENPFVEGGNDFGRNVGSLGAFYQHFENTWTNGGNLVVPTPKLRAVFHHQDPRIAETFQKVSDPAWGFNEGYKFVKYVHSERNRYASGRWAITSVNNTRLLRLADVKLGVAEAYLQTGQPAEARQEVNEVRARARKSTDDGRELNEPADLSHITMEDIMQERLRELAGEENHRWIDLKRWHQAGYINLADWNKIDFGFPAAYPDHQFGFRTLVHLRMPIPVSELNNNPEMLKSGQHPGY